MSFLILVAFIISAAAAVKLTANRIERVRLESFSNGFREGIASGRSEKVLARRCDELMQENEDLRRKIIAAEMAARSEFAEWNKFWKKNETYAKQKDLEEKVKPRGGWIGEHEGPYGPEQHTDTCACPDKKRGI